MMLSLEGLEGTTYNPLILQSLPQYCPSCPPALVLSLVQTESSGNQTDNTGNVLTSSAGAKGLFQVLPSTGNQLGFDVNDTQQNVAAGETYLQQLYNQFGDWNLALAAYNEGPGAVQKQLAAGQPLTSSGYASTILANAGITDTSTGNGTDTTDNSGDGTTPGTLLGLPSSAWIAIAAGLGLMALAR